MFFLISLLFLLLSRSFSLYKNRIFHVNVFYFHLHRIQFQGRCRMWRSKCASVGTQFLQWRWRQHNAIITILIIIVFICNHWSPPLLVTTPPISPVDPRLLSTQLRSTSPLMHWSLLLEACQQQTNPSLYQILIVCPETTFFCTVATFLCIPQSAWLCWQATHSRTGQYLEV